MESFHVDSQVMSYYGVLLFGSVTAVIIILLLGSEKFQSEKEDSYIAAVVEYQPMGSGGKFLPQTILEINSDKYVEFIKDAKINNADIVIFPEYGLTSLEIPSDPIAIRPFLVSVPRIGENPCNLPHSNPIIRKLSCAAMVEGIYVVINVGEFDPNCESKPDAHEAGTSACEDEEPSQYNTNVVFNRKGEIVAKYRKFHLYFESQFNRPTVPDYVTFETDFGVTFGTFICFDIMFQHPGEDYVRNGIQNFLFTTAWVDELPFLTATQSNAIWAMSANANLLVSGYHEPRRGRLGSGVFSGAAGPLNYTFDPWSGSKLIIAQVPILPHSAPLTPSKTSTKSTTRGSNHFFLKENLTDYSTIGLNFEKDAGNARVCHNEFCCSLSYGFEPSGRWIPPDEVYRLIAFSGFRKTAQGTAEFGWEICGVTLCQNATLESCTEIVKSSYDHRELDQQHFSSFKLSTASMAMGLPMKPSLNTLDTDLQPIPYGYFNFTRKEEKVEAESSLLFDIHVQTIALINRIY